MQIKLKQTLTAPLLVLVMYILLALSNGMNLNMLAQKDNVFLAVVIMQIIIFIIPGLLYCKFRGKGLIASLRFNPVIGAPKLWLTFTSFFVLVSGSALIKLILYTIGYRSTEYSLYQSYIPTSVEGFGNVLYIIIAIALMPAVTEEFIFRGIVLGEYTSSGCSKSMAIALSSLLFAMIHFNIYQLPIYLYGGIILAYVTVVTDSVICSIIIHFLNNGFSLLFESRLLNIIAKTDSIIFIFFILMTVFLLFLILSMQATERIYYIKGIHGDPSPSHQNKKHRRKKASDKSLSLNIEALISPSLLLCVIAFIIITFVF